MKTKKLNLNDLKVNSFITELSKNNVDTIKGGISLAVPLLEVVSAVTVVAVVAGVGVALLAGNNNTTNSNDKKK